MVFTVFTVHDQLIRLFDIVIRNYLNSNHLSQIGYKAPLENAAAKEIPPSFRFFFEYQKPGK